MIDPASNPVEYARTVVGQDPLATFLGIQVEEVREAYARCSVEVRPEYCNAVERAHGAITYSVSDQAFAVACNSTGTRALAVSFNITYLGAALPGSRLIAEATPVNRGKRISVWNIEVKDDRGNPVSRGEGIAYHRA